MKLQTSAKQGGPRAGSSNGSARSAVRGLPLRGCLGPPLDGDVGLLYKQKRYMATVKATAFRFTAEDLALLDAIQAHTGTITRTETLRTVLRNYARAQGIEVKKRGAKRQP
jgi:hypothetical protein